MAENLDIIGTGEGAGDDTLSPEEIAAAEAAAKEAADKGSDTDDNKFTLGDFVKDKWKETIPAEIKDRAEFSRFNSLEELYKSHIESQKTISSSVRIPGKDASAEDIQKFYEKIGKPKAAEEYVIEVPKDILDKGVQVDPNLQVWFRQKAFERNLSVDQAQGLYSDVAGYQIDQMAKQEQAVVSETTAAVEKLKSEWAGDYQKNIDFINSKLGSLYDADTIVALRNKGMLRDVGFIKNLYKLTKAVSGDMVYIDGKHVENPKETLETLTSERDKLMNEDYQKNLAKVNELNKKIVTIKMAQQKRPMG